MLALPARAAGDPGEAPQQETAAPAAPSLKDLVEQGIRLYAEGKYDAAITAFHAAYKLKPKATLLFNIGQAHRKAGRPRDALEAYDHFLREDPQTPLRAETEGYMGQVRAQLYPPPPPLQGPLHQAPPPPPVYRRPWFWVVLSAAAAGTATGIGLGIGLASRGPHPPLGIVEAQF